MSRPEHYPSRGNPSAAQAYYPSPAYEDRSDRGGRAERKRQQPQSQSQSQPQPQEQPFFEPPPTAAYNDPYSLNDQQSQQSEPFPDYGAGPPDPDARPPKPRPTPTDYFNQAYAESSDHSNQFNAPPAAEAGALTPYNEEKAEAEWQRGVEEAYTYQRQAPEPAPYDERRAYEDDLMREQRERDLDRIQWERERERRYFEDRDRQRERSRERERRRRREEDIQREKAISLLPEPRKGGRDIFGSSEGERGLAAKLAGGAGGAWIAHEVTGGDNVLGTLGGLVVGALAANTIEKQHEKRQKRKLNSNRRASADPYPKTNKYGEVIYPPPARILEDGRRSGRDGSREEVREMDRPSRQEGRSFVDNMKERVRTLSRSLSRKRKQEKALEEAPERAPRRVPVERRRAPRRRRSSYDSYDSFDSCDSYEAVESSRRR